MFYVYVLNSTKQAKLCYGSTSDLKKRLKEHNSGRCDSTKNHIPWELVYYEAYKSEADARLREQKLKYHGQAKGHLKKRIEQSLRQSAG